MMFFQLQPSEIKLTETDTTTSDKESKSARRKRKKRTEKYNNKKQLLKRETRRFSNSMSTWAENFTMAATWQLKHQVAHWKSKSKALEYENNILRNMLRQYYVNGKATETVDSSHEPMSMSAQSDSNSEEDATDGEEDEQEGAENYQISDEFVDFLKGNAEYRQIRIEREKLRQLEKEMPTKLLEKCPEAPADRNAEYQNIYGMHWERIAALEMSMESQFLSICDNEKPVLWPTIPLRL